MVDGVSFPLATSAVGITFADAALEESVRTSLIDVETALREAVASADPGGNTRKMLNERLTGYAEQPLALSTSATGQFQARIDDDLVPVTCQALD